MKIANCGFDYRHPSDFKINRPNGSGDFLLLVIRSDTLFVLNNTPHYTKGNSVILFKKDTPQLYSAYNEEFINDWIHFEADAEDIDYINKLGIPFDTIMEFQNVAELSRLIKHIFIEKYSNNKNAALSTDMYYKLILLKTSDLLEQNSYKSSAIAEQMTKLRNNIYSHPQKNWSIESISKALTLSPSYLQHQYKLLFGNSIKNDITKSRLEYSKYMLFSTDYTVSAIAYMCGYQSDVHFMRIFKREIGFTPTEYRTSLKHSNYKAKKAENLPPFPL